MTRPLLSVVDDDPEIAELVALTGEAAGFDVLISKTAEAFQDAYQKRRPGVVILDILMPGLDGNDLIHWLTEKGDSPPIIVISSFGKKYISIAKQSGVLRGANLLEAFPKPFDIEALEAVLKGVLEQS